MRARLVLPWLAWGIACAQLPPSVTLDAWNWQSVSPPSSKLESLAVHPDDENTWFASGPDGLWVTRDAGKTWTHPAASPILEHAVTVDPTNHNRVFVGSGSSLYVSQDAGASWQVQHQFPDGIASILVSSRDGAVYVAPANSAVVNGVNKSTDHGQTWTPHSFNYNYSDLLCWDIKEDPKSGTIYVGVEIANHPQPYHPPLFRSTDDGSTWQDVHDTVAWHVVSLQVDPLNQDVFALTEGEGLYRSSDGGTTWTLLAPAYFTLDLLQDPLHPARLFGGAHSAYSAGGVWASGDHGATFTSIGLSGTISASLALNKSATRLYVGTAGSGIFIAGAAPPKLTGNVVYARPGDPAAIACAGCSALIQPPTVALNGQNLPVFRHTYARGPARHGHEQSRHANGESRQRDVFR